MIVDSIMGFGADAIPQTPAQKAAGIICPPGANYCEQAPGTPSSLSPEDLARVKNENLAMQMQAADQKSHIQIAVGAALAGILIGVAVYSARK